jgi:hypothetical protein
MDALPEAAARTATVPVAIRSRSLPYKKSINIKAACGKGEFIP